MYLFIPRFSRKRVNTSEQQFKHLVEHRATGLVHQGVGAGIAQLAVGPA